MASSPVRRPDQFPRKSLFAAAFTICGDRCFLYESGAVIILAMLINPFSARYQLLSSLSGNLLISGSVVDSSCIFGGIGHDPEL